MQRGITVGDVTTDHTTGRTPSGAEGIKMMVAIARKARRTTGAALTSSGRAA